VPVAAAALLTVCGAGLALWLSSHRAGWLGPLVFGAGVFTVGFYGWIIYSAVHPLPNARSHHPLNVVDATENVGPGEQDFPAPQRQTTDGETR
jgi:hypothetical protein